MGHLRVTANGTEQEQHTALWNNLNHFQLHLATILVLNSYSHSHSHILSLSLSLSLSLIMSLLVSTRPSLSFRSNVYLLLRPTTTTTNTKFPLSSASPTPKPPPLLPTPRVHILHRAPYTSPCTPRAASAAAAHTILHDAGAAGAVLAGAYALVSAFDFLTQRNLIQQVCFFLSFSLYCV